MARNPTITERYLNQQIKCYYDLHVPAAYDDSQAWPLLISMHGYEGTKESMMRLSLSINDSDWLIASLQGPYQFLIRAKDGSDTRKVGFGWLTPYKSAESVALHHKNVLDLIGNTSKAYHIDPARIFILGFSQAVAVNYRFIFSNPNIIRGVVGVCGGIPGDFADGPYQNTSTEVLHIAATEDEYYPLERSTKFKDALETRAAAVEFRTCEGGHVFPRQSLSGINEWIKSRT
ncbi:MAG TPA: hypothetical protein VFC63_05920 [Blastocatellia bacterium]|nr:hypothetical protein [Blastocatellia bacterium]